MRASGPELRDLAAEIEWAKVVQVRPDEYAEAAAKHGRTPPFSAELTGRLFAGYEELRRDRHLIDFESVLELTAAILAEHRVAGAQVRDRYRYFVVDEYQDVNPLQKLLLDAWLGDRDDVCVVGDPRQTIYSFTGATSAYLTGFAAEYPHARVLRLVRNYRSTPEVVACANRLTRAGRGGRPWRRSARAGRPRSSPSTTTRSPRPRRSPPGRRACVAAGTPPREMAVLVRINAQTERFERALAEAGVPCQVRGAERFFDRPEVRQATGLLRVAARSARAAGADEAPDAGPRRRGRCAGRPVRSPRSGMCCRVSGSPRNRRPGGARPGNKWESLAALAQLAEDVCAATPGATLADVAAELARRAAIEHAPQVEGVTVASLHAAKGLEWDVVFLPGLTEGNLPIIHAETADAVAEERRLLYVGVTRARQQVLLSWPLARAPGGRRNRTPSRFLDGMRPARRAAAPWRSRGATTPRRASGAEPGSYR